MAFLGSVNFDFNKLFREGISYCDEHEAKKLREKFDEKLKFMETGDAENNVDEEIVVPIEEQELLDRVKYINFLCFFISIYQLNNFDFRAEIKEFLDLGDAERCIGKTCNAFQRKLIYQLLEISYRDTISASSRSVENRKVLENQFLHNLLI